MVVKNKQKRKMMRTRFGQSPRRHSRKGMKSCILAQLHISGKRDFAGEVFHFI